MSFRFIVKLIEKILGPRTPEGSDPADMFLPNFVASLGLVLIVGGIGFGIGFAVSSTIWMIAAAIGCFVLGVVALMCWKNQSIRVLTDEVFEYTTFLGNTYTYYFRDITGLRRNQDSLTLFVGGKKVHIESSAVMSERLVSLINHSLNKGL